MKNIFHITLNVLSNTNDEYLGVTLIEMHKIFF